MVQDNSAAWEPARDADNTFDMVQEINAGSPNIKAVSYTHLTLPTNREV